MKTIDAITAIVLVFLILMGINLFGFFSVYGLLILGCIVTALNDDNLIKTFLLFLIPFGIIEDILNRYPIGMTVILTSIIMITISFLGHKVSSLSGRVYLSVIIGHGLVFLFYNLIMYLLRGEFPGGSIVDLLNSVILGIFSSIFLLYFHSKQTRKVRV